MPRTRKTHKTKVPNTQRKVVPKLGTKVGKNPRVKTPLKRGLSKVEKNDRYQKRLPFTQKKQATSHTSQNIHVSETESGDVIEIKAPATTDRNRERMSVILMSTNIAINRTKKRVIHSIALEMDIVERESIVKNKGGGYSLRLERKYYQLYHTNQDRHQVTPSTIEYKPTTGLLKYYGTNLIWNQDRTYLPRRSKKNREPKVYAIGHTQIEGTASTKKIRVSPIKKTVENSIMTYSPDMGMKIGITIHTEIEQFVNFGMDIFKKVCPNPSPMTLAILEALGKRNWVGVVSEYPVYFKCRFSNEIIASSVDVICMDKETSRVVLIELKTGYAYGTFYTTFQDSANNNTTNTSSTKSSSSQNVQNNFFDNLSYPVNMMNGDFSTLKDSPLNRAQIQLITYMYFFRERLRVPCTGSVVHCTSDNVVKCFDIHDAFYEKYTRLIKKRMCIIGD
jgi:hypothetical protein